MGDHVPSGNRRLVAGLLGLGVAALAGCGDVLPRRAAPLFAMPLSVDDEPVGGAIVDTGGGYEVMLKDTFGLDVIDTASVLAYSGHKQVDITEPFNYSAGGWHTTARAAIVGLALCDCNGLGFIFFRRTGAVLAVDFDALTVNFIGRVPAGGLDIPFATAPPHLAGFDTSFVEVDVAVGDETQRITALLDTGSTVTVMRRGLFDAISPLMPNRLAIAVRHESLGEIETSVSLFDTDGLPDLILGNDAMRAWGDRWYFAYDPIGGTVTVFAGKTADGISPPSPTEPG